MEAVPAADLFGTAEATVTVPVGSLVAPDSPRLDGEDAAHVRALAEVEVPLPPVLVHRSSMRIIDGMHRLRAATLRGRTDIEVRFFDGSDEDAFVVAVQANIAHGLPLSLADRSAAAARILRSHPMWSDRAIASVTGLSAKTVGTIRRRSGVDGARLGTRVGRDGKVYPVDNVEARRIAVRLLTENPGASLREVARAAGISPATVRDVRDRLVRGEDPVPGRPTRRGPGLVPPRADLTSLLVGLRNDPSLRLSESGRVLLRLLSSQLIDPCQWEELGASVPPHCRGIVAELARGCAKGWHDFADHLDGATDLEPRAASS